MSTASLSTQFAQLKEKHRDFQELGLNQQISDEHILGVNCGEDADSVCRLVPRDPMTAHYNLRKRKAQSPSQLESKSKRRKEGTKSGKVKQRKKKHRGNKITLSQPPTPQPSAKDPAQSSQLAVLDDNHTQPDNMLMTSNRCVDAARKAHDLLQQKKAKKAAVITQHLEALIEDGKYLQESTNGFLMKLQSQEEDLHKALQQLQTEKGNLETEKRELLEKKANLESDLSSKSTTLEDNGNRLKEAEKEKRDAENELDRAKKKKKKAKKGFLGILKDFAGLLDGVKKKVDRAKRNLARLNSELQAAQNAVNSVNHAVAAVQVQIEQFEAKIRGMQQQIDKKHTEIGSVKNSIVLLRKSASFWSFFVIAAENAEECTANLKQFVDQAAEKKDYELLREDGTVTRANSFLAAWAMVANDHRIKD